MNLEQCLEQVRSLPEGDYAECGVYQGGTAEIIARHMAAGAALFLFDSFQGHQQPCGFDNPLEHPEGRYADTSIEAVAQRVPSAVIVPGWLPESLEAVKDFRFRFVHVDVDHYLPTRGCIEFFLPRMVQGGIMKFDDYSAPQGCPGAVKAVDETIGNRLQQGGPRFVKE